MTEETSDDGMSDTKKAVLTLVGMLILIAGAIAVGGMTPDTTDGGGVDEETEDPITQMQVVFEGDHSRSRIKEVVDASLGTFDIPANDETRRDVGDLVVNLDDGSEKTEFEIIACVSATGPGEGEEFEDMTKWENYQTIASGCALND
jgi:hypothetical protein